MNVLLRVIVGLAIGAGIVVALRSLLGPAATPTGPSDPDGKVLAQLQKAGSRLDRPHAVQFFLYFPTETGAQDAAQQLKTEGFEITVQPAAPGQSYLCQARKSMIPTHDALVAIRARFAQLTASLGGEYDGWGAGVVK